MDSTVVTPYYGCFTPSTLDTVLYNWAWEASPTLTSTIEIWDSHVRGYIIFITYLPRSLYIFLWCVVWDISPYYTPYITRYTLSMHIVCFLNNVVITTVIEMVEMVEVLNGRLGKHSVKRVRYAINNLLHLVIVKYGVISLVNCISTHLRLMTILSLLAKYLIILTRIISLIYI